jgi:hypothetical protein
MTRSGRRHRPKSATPSGGKKSAHLSASISPNPLRDLWLVALPGQVRALLVRRRSKGLEEYPGGMWY